MLFELRPDTHRGGRVQFFVLTFDDSQGQFTLCKDMNEKIFADNIVGISSEERENRVRNLVLRPTIYFPQLIVHVHYLVP